MLGIVIFTQNVKKNWRFAPIFFLVYLFSHKTIIFSIFGVLIFTQNPKISKKYGDLRQMFVSVYLFSYKTPKFFACGALVREG